WSSDVCSSDLPFCTYAFNYFVPAEKLVIRAVAVDSFTVQRQKRLNVGNIVVLLTSRHHLGVGASVGHGTVSGGLLRDIHFHDAHRHIKLESYRTKKWTGHAKNNVLGFGKTRRWGFDGQFSKTSLLIGRSCNL